MRTGYSMFETRLTMKGGDPLLVLRTARVIMVTLLVTVIMISFLYAQKIFGIFPSLIGFMIIALDPYIIALTRMNHLDAPVAVFMFLSLLTFIYYIWQGKNIFTLILSGVAGGFAFAPARLRRPQVADADEYGAEIEAKNRPSEDISWACCLISSGSQ